MKEMLEVTLRLRGQPIWLAKHYQYVDESAINQLEVILVLLQGEIIVE